jgi:adenylosuccinate synthase
LAELPDGARRYLDRIAELIRRPIEFVSVGPGREQTILD